MPSTNARTGAAAMPDTERSTAWGSVVDALASVRDSTLRAASDAWETISSAPFLGMKDTRGDQRAADARYGDPVGLGDARSSPMLRSDAQRALDQSGGDRENRPGMPADARAQDPWIWAAVAAGAVALTWAIGKGKA